MNTPREYGLFERLKRVVRYRLHIPMLRNKQSPTHVARGVMVGMIWAMTPFFGFQMGLVFATWMASRWLFGWNFCLVNGLAWTWTTNVFTLIPVFYLFYVTGQMLMGGFSDPVGYDNFKSAVLTAEHDAVENPSHLGAQMSKLWNAFGLPLFAGSAVWATITGCLAYWLSLGFVTRYREHRASRMSTAKKSPR
jgi:hypothetical protein